MKLALITFLICFSVIQAITNEELQLKLEEIASSPLVSLLFIYDSTSQNGPLMQRAIEEISKRKEGYFKIIPIDCNTDDEELMKNFPYCGRDIRSKLPALLYNEPALNPINPVTGQRNDPKNHQYQGNLQQKSLYEFAVPLMKLYSVNLKKASDWNKFQSTYPKTPKIIYFTDKEKVSPFFKTLTAHFRDTIAFAHVFKNSSLVQQFGVESFPALLFNGKKSIKLTSNLLQQIDLLRPYAGQSTSIVIQQFQELTNELSSDTLDEKIFQNARHILVHVPSEDGQDHPQWKKVQQSFRKMFDYFNGQAVVNELEVKHRPAIIYYPKSLVKKEVKKTIFYSNNNFRNIYDELFELIEDFTVTLSDQKQMQQLTSMALGQGRQVAVLLHNDDISLSYKVLSNDQRYQQSLAFFRMKNPPQQVLASFQVKKVPSLMVLASDKTEGQQEDKKKKKKQGQQEEEKGMRLQVAHYAGKFNYDDLQRYLNVFIQKPKEQEVETNSISLRQIKTKKHFSQQCLGQGCYLLLLDESPEKKASNELYTNILKKVSNKINRNIGILDGKCHSQILENLQIYTQDLPTLIYINAKFAKFSRLVGRIEQQSLLSFVQKVSSDRAPWRGYSQLIFENKDCAKEHERLKQLETSNYQMSAQEAQILEQIKKEQEMKKQESGEDKDSKKKRRKRRPKEEDSEL